MDNLFSQTRRGFDIIIDIILIKSMNEIKLGSFFMIAKDFRLRILAGGGHCCCYSFDYLGL